MNEILTNRITSGMLQFFKKRIRAAAKIRFTLLTVFIGSMFSFSVYSQCDTDEFLDDCATNLGTYNYIRSFTANAAQRKKTEREFTYVFSKGSSYLMVACNSKLNKGKVIITLFDRNHDRIGSTSYEEYGKDFSALKFQCNTTGVYHIRISFAGTSRGCGMCILGISNDRS
jgi:hypothetical protein